MTGLHGNSKLMNCKTKEPLVCHTQFVNIAAQFYWNPFIIVFSVHTWYICGGNADLIYLDKLLLLTTELALFNHLEMISVKDLFEYKFSSLVRI